MKTILNQLLKMQEKMNEQIDNRYIDYEEKSEQWQDSERGAFFQDKTDQMEEVLGNLDMTIDSVNDFIDQ